MTVSAGMKTFETEELQSRCINENYLVHVYHIDTFDLLKPECVNQRVAEDASKKP